MARNELGQKMQLWAASILRWIAIIECASKMARTMQFLCAGGVHVGLGGPPASGYSPFDCQRLRAPTAVDAYTRVALAIDVNQGINLSMVRKLGVWIATEIIADMVWRHTITTTAYC